MTKLPSRSVHRVRANAAAGMGSSAFMLGLLRYRSVSSMRLRGVLRATIPYQAPAPQRLGR
jgi:hypothetical protein